MRSYFHLIGALFLGYFAINVAFAENPVFGVLTLLFAGGYAVVGVKGLWASFRGSEGAENGANAASNGRDSRNRIGI